MTKQPSATQIARAERMRVAAKEGAEARAIIAARDIAIRKNMDRLKALRLAKEAEDATLAASQPAPIKKRSAKTKVLAET